MVMNPLKKSKVMVKLEKYLGDIINKDAIELICFKGGIRTVLLTP